MSHGAAALVLVACALGTYLFRGGVILLFADRAFPPAIERALQNVGPAVLAALTVNLAVSGGGGSGVNIVGAEMAALAVACGVAVWSKNLLWTLAAGMVALWVFSAL
jgi:branched-subunit amino acid transport protein